MKVSKSEILKDFKPFNIVLTIESKEDINLIYCICNHSFINQALENTHIHDSANEVLDNIYSIIKEQISCCNKSDKIFDSFDKELTNLILKYADSK